METAAIYMHLRNKIRKEICTLQRECEDTKCVCCLTDFLVAPR
jgi:hypothetical protein